MGSLRGKIALVTGASRGVGKGIARALGEQGSIVYVTGRSSGEGERTVEATARLVDEAGGQGRPIRCDHGDDAQIQSLFEQIRDESGHLDVLVNNVYKVPDPPAWGGGFWDHPLQIWDDQVGIGLRAHYVASWHAARLLFESPNDATILNVSSPGGQSYHFSASYGAGKAGLDRLSADMAKELKPKGVASLVLYPGGRLHGVHRRLREADRHGSVGSTDAAVRRANRGRTPWERRPDGAHRHDPVGRGSR